MSCNYADGLSPYDNKGVLGLAEHFDSPDVVKDKCEELAKYIKEAKHVVIHTGAGISTSAGIPDFRGPKGVWTLEEKGLKPDINVSFTDAKPTRTHMAIKKFIDEGVFHYIVSQNIDGLHLKSGVSREHIAELHGNMFVEQCNICKRQFVRCTPTTSVGLKVSERQCRGDGRPCRGKLQDTILDWEHSLPDDDLELSDLHASIADLSICMGSTLQIIPSGNIPLNTLRYGGRLVICNLQPTKHDNKADLIINTYVDNVMENVANILGITIPNYSQQEDPTTLLKSNIEWTIKKSYVTKVKKLYKSKCSGVAKKRILAKRPSNFRNSDKIPKKMKKNELIDETPVIKKNTKIKKPPKHKKIKEEDRIIVINDEDSNGSDVIFVDEDIKNDENKVTVVDNDRKDCNAIDEIQSESQDVAIESNLSHKVVTESKLSHKVITESNSSQKVITESNSSHNVVTESNSSHNVVKESKEDTTNKTNGNIIDKDLDNNETSNCLKSEENSSKLDDSDEVKSAIENQLSHQQDVKTEGTVDKKEFISEQSPTITDNSNGLNNSDNLKVIKSEIEVVR